MVRTRNNMAQQVFGSIVSDTPNKLVDDSLCYSPSPEKVSRLVNNINVPIKERNSSSSSAEESSMSTTVSKKKEDGKGKGKIQAFSDVTNTTNTNRSSASGKPNNDKIANEKKDAKSYHEKKRKDLFELTRAAVAAASLSVSESLNASKKAREEAEEKRRKEVEKVRLQRKMEKLEGLNFNEEAERMKRELVQMKNEFSSQYRRQKAKMELDKKQEKLAMLSQEIKFKSDVYREHKQYLEDDDRRRRRESSVKRFELRKNHRQGELKMKMARIEEESALLEHRYDSSLACNDYKNSEAEKRRNSFALRGEIARQAKQNVNEIKAENLQAEYESYELKRLSDRDVDAYKKQCADDRRDSFALRGEIARQAKQNMNEIKAENKQAEYESYELERLSDRDADAYKKQCADDRRDSFALRGEIARQAKQNMNEIKAENKQAEYESYELKRLGDQDADAYKKACAEDRRDSFALRGEISRYQKKAKEVIRSEALNTEYENYELKRLGDRDVDAYKKQCEDDRRDSFALRGEIARQAKQNLNEIKAENKQAEYESYELKRLGDVDVDAYKKQCEDKRRDSFALRGEIARQAKQKRNEIEAEKLKSEYESYELKRLGDGDVDAYKKQCADEIKEDFQKRGEDARRHKAVMEEIRSLALEKEHESNMLKWAAEEDVKNYLHEQEESKRIDLKLRGKEKLAQRVLEQEEREVAFKKDQENRRLEDGARADVRNYLQSCKKRRRFSLAFRAQEKRRHMKYEKEQREKEIQKQNLNSRYRSMDDKFVELAKQKEKAKAAIDNYYHLSRGCSFAQNPFSFLLD